MLWLRREGRAAALAACRGSAEGIHDIGLLSCSWSLCQDLGGPRASTLTAAGGCIEATLAIGLLSWSCSLDQLLCGRRDALTNGVRGGSGQISHVNVMSWSCRISRPLQRRRGATGIRVEAVPDIVQLSAQRAELPLIGPLLLLQAGLQPQDSPGAFRLSLLHGCQLPLHFICVCLKGRPLLVDCLTAPCDLYFERVNELPQVPLHRLKTLPQRMIFVPVRRDMLT
mmetsp:Transcript_55651/g.172476  ORF Transcript_55651/g.172476 Transcript_55651/m.172476 type:complete len:226 (-) Transcript_55651:869-1546(-)